MFEKPEFFWLFLLLPVVVLYLIYDIWLYKKRTKKIAGKHFTKIIPYYSESQKWLKIIFYTLGIVFTILALARPKWGSETINTNLKGRNILVLLDVSYSMATADVVPSRFETAKRYINEILSMGTGDRMGIMVFSGESELIVPVTHDYAAIAFFLDSLYPGMLGRGGTNIANALTNAITTFDNTEAINNMILLLTDGEELQGNFKSIKKKIIDSGIKVFTVGIGTRSGEPIPILNDRGEIESYVKNSKGEHVVSQLDEKRLHNIASSTEASYMRSTGSKGEMRNFITSIESVSKKEHKNLTFIQKKDRYDIFLIPALILFVIGFILDQGKLFKKNGTSGWVKHFLFMFVIFLTSTNFNIASESKQQEIKQIKNQKNRGFFINNGGFWGNRHFEKGNYKKALDSYISAADEQKGNELSKLYYNIANTFYRLKDYKNSGTYYEKALANCSVDELKSNIFYNYGTVNFKLKDYSSAEQLFKRSLLYCDDDDTRYNYYVSHLLAEKQKNESDKDQKEDNQNNKKEQEDNSQQQKQNEQEISKETIEQLLKALDEKEKSENRKNTEQKQNQNKKRVRYW